jgi:hypothetical protein
MNQAAPRYEAREDTVLDSFGGGRSFRVVPIMGQTDEEARAIARVVAAALNGETDPTPARIFPDGERHDFLRPSR